MEAGVKTGLLMNFNVTSGGVVNRTGYYTPQVLSVSFVVKQFCTSERVLAFDPFSLITHSKRQRADILSAEGLTWGGIRERMREATAQFTAHNGWNLCVATGWSGRDTN